MAYRQYKSSDEAEAKKKDAVPEEKAGAAGTETKKTFSKGDLVYDEKARSGFFGLPHFLPFPIRYKIYENDIEIVTGLINIREDDCYMYRISDVSLTQSLFQRLFKIGTVRCYTSDMTTKVLELKNIHNSKEIKDFIYKAAEESKMNRPTVNMQNISAGGKGGMGPGMM